MKIFGERLKELREEKGLSYRQLAKELGVSSSSINSWEKEIRVASIDNLLTICKYFNVSSDYMIGLED
ncbi:MAG: helix-turn-helix transcriptional regulator [Clostridia bacterium]|nr:helix-turn-helix transcriptional regulator [Clostridia bacterium]